MRLLGHGKRRDMYPTAALVAPVMYLDPPIRCQEVWGVWAVWVESSDRWVGVLKIRWVLLGAVSGPLN